MEFIQQADSFLLSQGYTQGATKTTQNNYQKGRVEIILYDSSFIRRKVFQGRIFSQIIFKNASLARLKIVAVKESKNVLFKKAK